jgi:xanthine dehydrogenase accessory factor
MNLSHFSEVIVLIKGAGEKASAVAHRLHQGGLNKIVMTDLRLPMAERRGVSFCEALLEGQKEVEGVAAQRVGADLAGIHQAWTAGRIPVIEDPQTETLKILYPDVLVDGIMAKRNTGTALTGAPLVIALGPGFVPGVDAHQVIETNPASIALGHLISKGSTEPETGIPTPILGLSLERLIVSPGDGILSSLKNIGNKVEQSEPIARVGDRLVLAPIPGVIWGLIRDGLAVKEGQKIGDIDPRGDPEQCFEITPQARSIAEGVWKGIMNFFHLTGG